MVTINKQEDSIELVNGTSVVKINVHATVDTTAELPTPEDSWAAGSRCDVVTEDKTYALGNDRQWHEVHFFDGGGSGAPIAMFTPMTQAEYDALGEKTQPLYFIYDEESTSEEVASEETASEEEETP